MDDIAPITYKFTCISCRVAFQDAEIQRSHYKTDWHRYNLKRKVAELPPVSSEEFQRKVLNQRNANNVLEHTYYCQVCKKNFGNENAYNNHLNSKKHKETEKNCKHDGANSKSPAEENQIECESETEELDSDEWEDEENPIDNNDCMFCLHHSESFMGNVEHMTTEHSFFIPDIEYCTDIEGLIHYLSEKISDGFMCLWCNEKGRTFHSADAARKHMVDKGHCKIIHEGVALAEYADFYDYSSSYPDANNQDVDPAEEVQVSELDGSEYQLVLPSGVTIGHRSLMRYYKQSVDPNKAVVVSKKNDRKLHKVLATYRALGWTATEQTAAAKKARDIHYMKRLQSKYMTKLGVRNNKLQKHFRPQVNF